MRRILLVLFAVILVLFALAALIARGGEIATILQSGQGIIALILSLLQLIGIALLIGLAIFVLIQYIQYVHPIRFVFEGFSNASILVDALKLPFDISILAREKLILQFRSLDSQWEDISGVTNPDAGVDALLTDGLYFGKSREKLDLRQYLPADVIGAPHVLEELREVINSIRDSAGNNLMSLVEEIVPEEVTPVMKFLEAVVPPHIIRATGHLQWQNDEQDGTGITFEFVDLGSQRNLMVKTILWKSPVTAENGERKATQTSPVINFDDFTAQQRLIAQKQEQEHPPEEDKCSLAAKRFNDLLNPATRWLALMFWQQQMISNTPRHDKRRQAQVLYLFGALYYACANTDQYQPYKDFFCQLAIEQFRLASLKDPSWGSPFLYLANLYSFKMQEEEDEELHTQLLESAIVLYQDALDAESTKDDQFTRHRILIARALAELTSGEAYLKLAIKDIEQLMQELDPNCFDPKRAGCAAFFYNLALWYGYAAQEYPAFSFARNKQNTRLYVTYCLACSLDQWDAVMKQEEFRGICDVEALEYLKSILEARQKKSPRLTELKGRDFNEAVKEVLREVAKQKDWVKDGI